VGDPRSTPHKLVKDPLASSVKCANLRLDWRVGDLRSTHHELVRGFLASPREYANSRLHLRIEDPRSTSDDCGDIALGRPS
jgi:hypothetical protein